MPSWCAVRIPLPLMMTASLGDELAPRPLVFTWIWESREIGPDISLDWTKVHGQSVPKIQGRGAAMAGGSIRGLANALASIGSSSRPECTIFTTRPTSGTSTSPERPSLPVLGAASTRAADQVRVWRRRFEAWQADGDKHCGRPARLDNPATRPEPTEARSCSSKRCVGNNT